MTSAHRLSVLRAFWLNGAALRLRACAPYLYGDDHEGREALDVLHGPVARAIRVPDEVGPQALAQPTKTNAETAYWCISSPHPALRLVRSTLHGWPRSVIPSNQVGSRRRP